MTPQELENREVATRASRKSRVSWVMSTCSVILILRGILDFVYIEYVFPYFGGTIGGGSILTYESHPLRILGSYVITLVLAAWLVTSLYHRRRPSGVALILLFVTVVLPVLSLYALSSAPALFTYAVVMSFVILLMLTGSLPRLSVPYPAQDFLSLGITALVVTSVYVYGWLLFTGGVGRLSFDLSLVYDVRAEYVQTRWPLIGYLLPWQAHVVNVGVLCYALHRKSRWLMATSILAQLLLFGMTGHKSHLLSPALAVGTYLLWPRRDLVLYVMGGASALILITYGLFLIDGDHLLPSLFIRRLFFVPAGNHLVYYDFFSRSDNPFVMLSNSILGPFVGYPYGAERVTRVISWAYWGRDFGPNVGYLGDAFAHFGLTGMFFFSVILGAFLTFVDSVGARLPRRLVAGVFATPAMALTNSGLFTSLLTHGLIPSLVMIWLLAGLEHRRTAVREAKARDARRAEQIGAASRTLRQPNCAGNRGRPG